MISENDIDKALDYLRNSAVEAAQARANVRHLSEFLESKAAAVAKDLLAGGQSAAAAKLVAKADPSYVDLLDGYKVAVEQDAKHTLKREAAVTLIDAWRTQQSTLRAEGKAYG